MRRPHGRWDSYWLHPCVAYKLNYNLSLEWRVSWEITSIWILEEFRYIFCVLFQMDQQFFICVCIFRAVLLILCLCYFSEIKRYETDAFLLYMKVNFFFKCSTCCLLHAFDSSEWHIRRGLPRLEVFELINISHHSFLWHSSHNGFRMAKLWC